MEQKHANFSSNPTTAKGLLPPMQKHYQKNINQGWNIASDNSIKYVKQWAIKKNKCEIACPKIVFVCFGFLDDGKGETLNYANMQQVQSIRLILSYPINYNIHLYRTISDIHSLMPLVPNCFKLTKPFYI